jgi:hypothetical protein
VPDETLRTDPEPPESQPNNFAQADQSEDMGDTAWSVMFGHVEGTPGPDRAVC